MGFPVLSKLPTTLVSPGLRILSLFYSYIVSVVTYSTVFYLYSSPAVRRVQKTKRKEPKEMVNKPFIQNCRFSLRKSVFLVHLPMTAKLKKLTSQNYFSYHKISSYMPLFKITTFSFWYAYLSPVLLLPTLI